MAELENGKRSLEGDAVDKEDIEDGHIPKTSLSDVDRILALLESALSEQHQIMYRIRSELDAMRSELSIERSDLDIMGNKLAIAEGRLAITGNRLAIVGNKVDEAVNAKNIKSQEYIQILINEMEKIQAAYMEVQATWMEEQAVHTQMRLDHERAIDDMDRFSEQFATVQRDVRSLLQKKPEERRKCPDELMDELDDLLEVEDITE
ncbi:uncharacterized protein TrAtP1_007947 [Trichoderma atroviride]|uniref:Uncharacterized protein n=1 Tax=Hypocrea atroviridis (strain ATCC 20476 / IMI 206040) TaxID=452589 RepID=G9NHG5_HYPAI|nr:uncharacterized protein TRIATDRAFT_314893 [Trichoderma atroviride IMI 206040]EHK50059.1 hypothetical protein TRIATDRAFT_314893 [Trichoderma atroviride IMI 206040]UKZ66777.1 hypothetical protein TrAtP1_007947 [Trichoderma atroviride]